MNVQDPQSLSDQVSVGDKVEVEKQDGTILRFVVTAVSPSGLNGDDVSVSLTDIRQVRVVEQMRFTPAVFLAVVAVAAVILLVTGNDCVVCVNSNSQ